MSNRLEKQSPALGQNRAWVYEIQQNRSGKSCGTCALCGGAGECTKTADAKSNKLSTKATISSSALVAHDPSDDNYVIGPDDVLAINVWKEPDLSRTVPVRPDGKITLPLVGDIGASGTTPKQLQTTIQQSLSTFVSQPAVAVIVQEGPGACDTVVTCKKMLTICAPCADFLRRR